LNSVVEKAKKVDEKRASVLKTKNELMVKETNLKTVIETKLETAETLRT